MMDLEQFSRSRIQDLRKSLQRFRLVFVQCGIAYRPLHQDLLSGCGLKPVNLSQVPTTPNESESGFVVSDLESALTNGSKLGQLRASVHATLDAGQSVCLMSRAPRSAYGHVVGSSILEDCALHSLRPLESQVLAERPRKAFGMPAVAFDASAEVPHVLSRAVAELGSGLMAALDKAIWEVDPRGDGGLEHLAARDVEELRAAGLIKVDQQRAAVADFLTITDLRRATAQAVASSHDAHDELAAIATSLWFIERRIRSKARAAAIESFGAGWRDSCLGGLSHDALDRAQSELGAVTRLKDLRDPFEWLSLGELLEVSSRFDNLGIPSTLWRRFREEIGPVRNRQAHVRLFHAGDHRIASKWETYFRSV